MIRRFGEAPIPQQRYGHRPGAYAIIEKGGDLLVTHQAAPYPEVQLPGGGIDPGESPLQALHREVEEETGWIISVPRRLGAFRRFVFMPEYDKFAEKVCHIYLAKAVYARGAPTEAGHMALFMPPSVAVEVLANSGDRHFVRQLFGV
ncbi:NUDIX domain-containing protein [Litoreibacter roseus]|uniref:NUDIX hydrolase n=1 Tax=Litoreibacter roseus TaxID=2601869 RepID=A0A6N6JEF4_9RHOB|nr:NUDIX hydrolase [Litoreibacter roseus]GFE64731.1 NUDIX hydrolase [Litoreibacter roseus]